MKLKIVSQFLAVIVFLVAAFMLTPLLWAISEEPSEAYIFILSIAAGLALSIALRLLGRGAGADDMGTREAFASVSFAWVLASLLGCLPYLISGTISGFANAYFEAMSGFTTTGATVMNSVDTIPQSILLWRSQTQWLGGMGIVVLIIAVLPMLGISVNQLFKAETPGFNVEKIRPRMRDAATILWGAYMVVTVAGILLMLMAKLSFFDAVCHIFAVVSTGGFSSRDAGLFDSAGVEWATCLIMFFCGANFNLLLISLKKENLSPYNDPEFRFYLRLTIIVGLIVAAFLFCKDLFNLHDSLRHALFQTVSIVTTTGFAVPGYELWPIVIQTLLLFMMFIGGCNGSTAGGIKCSRTLIVFKQIYAEIRRFLHPDAVVPVRVGNRTVNNAAASSASAFIALYICVFMASALILSATGQSAATALSGVAATLSNVGSGPWVAGLDGTFQEQPFIAKWVYIFCMLCGRLELYTVLVLFTKDAWRR